MSSLKERMDALVAQRLVNVRTNTAQDLFIYKYSKKVFFKNLWDQYPDLKEARGLILNEKGDIVAYPFTKVFNNGENKSGFAPSQEVVAVQKVNGFLGVASLDKYGSLLISTSGTMDSEFAELARMHIGTAAVWTMLNAFPGYTAMFEICDPSDSHIIKENIGAHFIGMRKNVEGSALCSEAMLDGLFDIYLKNTSGFFRPSWTVETYGNVLKDAENIAIHEEGWMCYAEDRAVKVKTKHYLMTKFLSRTRKDLSSIWESADAAKEILPEEFYHLIVELPKVCSHDEWNTKTDREKVALLQCLI